MERKVVVIGATGNTGIEVCNRLSKLKIEHSAIVRPGSERKVSSSATKVILANILDVAEIEKVFEDNSFTDVIITLGSRDLKKLNIRSNGTINVLSALHGNTSTKLHILSAVGVRESWAQLSWFNKLISNLLIKATMVDHALQEEAVVAGPNPYHIVRAVGLKDVPATGKVYNQTTGFLPKMDISRADVANYMVDSMLINKIGTSSICKG